MIPTLVPKPFHRDGWVYEEKVGGYRMLAYKEGARVRLVSRTGVDHIHRYPGVASAVAQLRPRTLVLDGELALGLPGTPNGGPKREEQTMGRSPAGRVRRHVPALRRRLLFRLATSDTYERLVRALPPIATAAHRRALRYVAGETLDDALAVARTIYTGWRLSPGGM